MSVRVIFALGDRVRVKPDASLAYGGCEGEIVQIPHVPVSGPAYWDYGVRFEDGKDSAPRGFQLRGVDLLRDLTKMSAHDRRRYERS